MLSKVNDESGAGATAQTSGSSAPAAFEPCFISEEDFENSYINFYSELTDSAGHSVRLDKDGDILKFVVPMTDEYQLTLTAQRQEDGTSTGIDPSLTVFRYREDGTCPAIGGDDDGGDQSLDSKLPIKLENGNYFVFVSSLESSGDAILKMEKVANSAINQ